jgi:hypothetical protein
MWLHALAKKHNYSSLLLEGDGLGGKQTLNSQGIIHGGTKYTLQGKLSKSADTIASMPSRWKECIEGNAEKTGNINLSSLNILSKSHYLWSSNKFSSKMAGFFASKSMQSRIAKMDKKEFMEPFCSQKGNNSLYKLNEFIIDTSSLAKCLSDINPQSKTLNLSLENLKKDKNKNTYIDVDGNIIRAKMFIFCSGAGNKTFLPAVSPSVKSQTRPLHMLAIYDKNLPEVYAHAVEISSVPRLTITTHKNDNGENIWYLGGKIAEDGVKLSSEELIEKAKKELNNLLPDFKFSSPKFKSIKIDRAENKQGFLKRPDSSFMHIENNTMIVWPIKFTLLPSLGDRVFDYISSNIEASTNPSSQNIDFLKDSYF